MVKLKDIPEELNKEASYEVIEIEKIGGTIFAVIQDTQGNQARLPERLLRVLK